MSRLKDKTLDELIEIAMDNNIHITELDTKRTVLKKLGVDILPPLRNQHRDILSLFMIAQQRQQDIQKITLINDVEDNVMAIVNINGKDVLVYTIYLEYLFNLQKSGKVNMYESWPLLAQEFELKDEVAIAIFKIYMDKYEWVKEMLEQKLLAKVMYGDVRNITTSFLKK